MEVVLMFESLRSISDHKILCDTDAIIVQERKLTLRLLVHLHEIERRKLYLIRGYGSMFVYCTTHLRLSASAASRRIRTARCLARFPELYAMLESGEVNLSTVSLVSKILNQKNHASVLGRISGKSQRDVAAIVAEYEPRAVLPADHVRTIVVAVPIKHTNEYNRSGGQESSTVEGSTPEEGRRAGDPEKSPAATASSSETMTLERHAVVKFTARELVMNKLEHARSIASHRLSPNASLEDVIEFLANYFTEREDPAKRHARREARKNNEKRERARTNTSTKVNEDAKRRIPVRVRDQVFVRDKGQCAYVSRDGKRCGSMHVLQIDHINPVARGGASSPDNLRLLCAYHNRLEAERLMGRSGRRLRSAQAARGTSDRGFEPRPARRRSPRRRGAPGEFAPASAMPVQ